MDTYLANEQNNMESKKNVAADMTAAATTGIKRKLSAASEVVAGLPDQDQATAASGGKRRKSSRQSNSGNVSFFLLVD